MKQHLLRLLIGILVVESAAVAAEPVRVPWNRVAALVSNAEVAVETTSRRKKVDGRVVNVRPESIELRTQTGNISLRSTEVSRIRIHGRTRAPAGILIGAAAGAGLFALLAHPSKPLFKDGGIYQVNADGTQTKLDTDPHPNYGLAAAVGAGIGGVTGWWAGSLSSSRGMVIEIVPGGQPSPPPVTTHMNRGELQ